MNTKIIVKWYENLKKKINVLLIVTFILQGIVPCLASENILTINVEGTWKKK